MISIENDGVILFESERLLFRNLLESDADELFAMDSDPNVHKYLDFPAITEREEALHAIKSIRAQYEKFGTGRLAVICKVDNNFIGWAGIKFDMEEMNGKVNFYDLGYRFKKAYWGQGYGSEVAIILTNYAFDTLKIPLLTGSADVRHVASNRILEKVGMQLICTYEESNMMWTWYEITREEWLNKHSTT